MKYEQLYIGLRGLTRGSLHWGDFQEHLAGNESHNYFIPIDIPGNGKKNLETTETNPIVLVKQLHEELITLKRKHNLPAEIKTHIIGVSLGGIVALKWIELYPDDADSITVINSSLSQYSKFYHRLFPINYFKILSALFVADDLKKESLVLKLTSNDPKKQIAKISEYLDISKTYQVTRLNFFRQLLLATKVKIDSTKIKKPIIVICSKKDNLVSYKCSEDISKGLNCKLHIHTDAGHDLPLDAPEWLSHLIKLNNFTT